VNYQDGSNQSASPNGNLAIQAGPVDGFINGIPSSGAVYWIRTLADGNNAYTYVFTLLRYPISDPKLLSIHGGNNGSVNWALAQATSGTQVSWGDNVGELQEWVFQAILH
jgi:hypothetical protein